MNVVQLPRMPVPLPLAYSPMLELALFDSEAGLLTHEEDHENANVRQCSLSQ